jgi:hypothetical protein
VTRREALLALALMYALFVAGLTWWLGPIALAAAGMLGLAAVAFLFERVEARGEAVPDAVPREWREALDRDLPL